MKILYFNYLYDLYGSSIGSTRKAELLMSELAKLGNEVNIYWMKKQYQAKQPTIVLSKKVLKKYLARFLHDPKLLLLNLKYLFQENKLINQENPDLIISRLDLYLFSSLLLAKLKKIPIIIEADCPCVFEAREFQKQYWYIPSLAEYIEKMNLKKSDMTICVSNTAKQYFIEQGIPEENITVISNGANIDKFNPSICKKRIIEKHNLAGKTIIGFVGSFHFWHGVDNLIKVIKHIIFKNKNTAFLMVGEGGPMKSTLENFVENEGLTDRVILTGYIPYEEMPEYISAMDIVLALYPNLNFFYYSPVKIFEYMACGKPIVTTKIGQIAEIMKDGHDGLLCEPDNIEEIIQNLHTLIRNPELRSVIGRNAREAIKSNHTWNIKAKELAAICKDVYKKYH